MHPCERAGRGATPTLTPRGMILYLSHSLSHRPTYGAPPDIHTRPKPPDCPERQSCWTLHSHVTEQTAHPDGLLLCLSVGMRHGPCLDMRYMGIHGGRRGSHTSKPDSGKLIKIGRSRAHIAALVDGCSGCQARRRSIDNWRRCLLVHLRLWLSFSTSGSRRGGDPFAPAEPVLLKDFGPCIVWVAHPPLLLVLREEPDGV